jgi:hypothetical protein
MKPIRHYFNDSSSAQIQEGVWDFNVPCGRHVRGQAANNDEALGGGESRP